MTFEQILQYVFAGITNGSIYAVVAIGFNIIYNSTGIINFSQGEFVMLGGMTACTLSLFLPLPIAILLAVIITAAIGAFIEIVFIRTLNKSTIFQINFVIVGIIVLFSSIILHNIHLSKLLNALLISIISIVSIIIVSLYLLYNEKGKAFLLKSKKTNVLQMIIVTIGLSIIIREVALHIWDEKVRALPFFTGTEISSINIFGAHISPQVLWVIAVTALIVIILTIFFKFTITGQAMRACSSNKDAAGLCGINTQLMITLSFVLSAAIGALAGAVVSPITQTQYDMGTGLAIKGFTVAILGGLGNSMAAVIAGLLIGLIEAFSISLLPMAFKDVITIGLLLLIIFVKPSGLFGSKESAALKDF